MAANDIKRGGTAEESKRNEENSYKNRDTRGSLYKALRTRPNNVSWGLPGTSG
jgi:hypothetical protein